MFAKETPLSDERAVETGQQSVPAQGSADAGTVGYHEPHQLTKLAQNGRLYVIGDSVGGAASGQIASQYAVKQILYSYYNSDTPDLEARLLDVIQQTNAEIHERNREHPQRRMMATTVMAVLVHGNKLLVANVGDSRVYVVWDQDIEWLNSPAAKSEKNDDDPDTPKLIPAEATPPEDLSSKDSAFETTPLPPTREPVPAALGLEPEVKIETFSRRLFAGDVIVLASGSLTGYVAEKEIARAMTKHSPDQAIQRLMALANERGNRSHISISVTRVLSSPVAMRSPLPMIMPKAPTWSDWEKPPKPGQSSAEKPATRPLSKPVPPSPPVTKSLARPTSVDLPLNKPSYDRSRGCLFWFVLLLILCAVPLLAWRYLIPSEFLAAIPILGDVIEQTESLDLDPEQEAEPEIESAVVEPDGSTQASPTQVVEQSPPLAATTVPTAAVVAENNSPLPTPTAPAAASETTDTIIIDTPTPTPLPLPTIALPANCESKARFVTDVTVEDGTRLGPATPFDKVWRVRNEGTCPWGPGFSVRFLNGDNLGVTNEARLVDVTNPDETLDIAVSMIAPEENGAYRGVWQLYDLTDQPFGPTMFLEIEVAPGGSVSVDPTGANTLFDFVESASDASWSSGQVQYSPLAATISEELDLPESGGLVAIGPALLRGNVESTGNALLTYPHQDLGFIQGDYLVDVPLQPGDALAATLGFTRLSILSDDGVVFEVSFTPDDGSNQVLTLLSQAVVYRDSPITETFPLEGIQAGQTGAFTLRVLGGESTSRDWALWIDLRLIRP